jgi:hypothetical protein
MSDPTLPSFPEATSECIHCRNRLSSLEQAISAHAGLLGEHGSEIACLRAELRGLSASNARIETVLGRILDLVTSTAERN